MLFADKAGLIFLLGIILLFICICRFCSDMADTTNAASFLNGSRFGGVVVSDLSGFFPSFLPSRNIWQSLFATSPLKKLFRSVLDWVSLYQLSKRRGGWRMVYWPLYFQLCCDGVKSQIVLLVFVLLWGLSESVKLFCVCVSLASVMCTATWCWISPNLCRFASVSWGRWRNHLSRCAVYSV